MWKYIFVIGILFACKTESKKSIASNKSTKTEVEENNFLKAISSLPTLSLPYTTNCDRCCEYVEFDSKSDALKKIEHPASKFVGIVRKKENEIIILRASFADNIFPTIEVYDSIGNLRDSKSFMTSYCGRDFNYFGKQFLEINSDYVITTVDTSLYVKLDTVSHKIIDTIKTEILQKTFIISEEGKIIEESSFKIIK